MISETASAALYVTEVLYTAILWAFCAEGLFPPQGRRAAAFCLVAGSGMAPVIFVLWFPAGTDEFYLSGTLLWLMGMLLETLAYCMVYEGAWTQKVGWYLAAFWAMNEAETLPWSVYMTINEGQMGAYGVFSTLRTPWEYLPIAAAYLLLALLIRFVLRQLHRLLPRQKRFATVLCAAALAVTAFMMESDVIYMEVTARDGAMRGMGGVYILEGLSAVTLLVVVLLAIRILHKVDLQNELREADRERLRQEAYFSRTLAQDVSLETQQRQEKAMLEQVIALLENNRTAEARQALQAAGIPRANGAAHYTNNHVVNAALCEIGQQCGEQGVSFEIQGNLPDKIDMADIDLSALVGNLLSNALESCLRLPGGAERSIRLRFTPGGGSLLICCENSAPAGKIDFGRSAKTAAGHGYGSRILDYIAQKYGGKVERAQNAGTVCVSVMVQGVLGEREVSAG
jgi:hypothetical protein